MQNRVMAGRTRRVEAVRRRKKKLSPEKVHELIHSMRGCLKRKPGEKSLVQELIEKRRAEKELEDRKFQRLASLGKK